MSTITRYAQPITNNNNTMTHSTFRKASILDKRLDELYVALRKLENEPLTHYSACLGEYSKIPIPAKEKAKLSKSLLKLIKKEILDCNNKFKAL